MIPTPREEKTIAVPTAGAVDKAVTVKALALLPMFDMTDDVETNVIAAWALDPITFPLVCTVNAAEVIDVLKEKDVVVGVVVDTTM